MKKCKITMEENRECQNCCFFCDKKETCEDVCGEMEEDVKNRLMYQMNLMSSIQQFLMCFRQSQTSQFRKRNLMNRKK